MQFNSSTIGKTLFAGFLMLGLVACPPAPVVTPDFSLTLGGASVTVKKTESGTMAVSLNKTGGFTDSVALSLEGTPTGVTSSFNPASTSSASALTLNVAANAAVGETTLTVKGISGTLTKTATFKLTVTAAPVTGDTTPPTVVSTTASSNTSVTVVFSEAIAGGSLATNFSFPSQGLNVSAASLAADNKTVTLTTSAQSAISYALLVSSSLTDLAGNAYNLALQNTTQTSFQGTNSSITSVTASSDMPVLSGGTQASLSAVVVGTGTFSNAVTWSISNGVGSLSATTGSPVIFSVPSTAPNGTTVVRATSNQDSSKFGEVSLTITAAAPGVTAVTISAAVTTVLPATNTKLTANVTGIAPFSNAVTWSIVSGNAGGLSATTGSEVDFMVTGSSSIPQGAVEIKATSNADPTKFGTITMTVQPASITGLTISAQKTALNTGGTSTLTATITSSGNEFQFSNFVNWKIENDGVGTLSSGGNGSLLFNSDRATVSNTYTAPASSFGRVVRITVSSVQDPTKTQTIFVGVNPNKASISGGQNYSLALKTDGTVLSWGEATNGQLGNNSNQSSPTPIAVQDSSSAVKPIVAVAAGGFHSLALRNDGTLISWGDNFHGQLGTGLSGAANSKFVAVDVIPLTSTERFSAIATGTTHSLALRTDGVVVSWGDGRKKQLGSNQVSSTVLNAVTGTSNIVAIAAGVAHSLALKADGTVLAWGDDEFGQLGDNATNSSSFTPVAVQGASNIVAIAAGLNHSVALKKDGTVLTWGSDEFGQLGDGTPVDDSKSTPVVVSGASNIVGIAAGGFHTLALKADGTMQSWGKDNLGQLGNNAALENSASPVSVLLGAFTIRLP